MNFARRFAELLCGGRGIVMLKLALTAFAAGAAVCEPKRPGPDVWPLVAGSAEGAWEPPPAQPAKLSAAMRTANVARSCIVYGPAVTPVGFALLGNVMLPKSWSTSHMYACKLGTPLS